MSTNIQAGAGIRLDTVQGNILKGHGRKYATLVLFRLGPDRAKNRQLLRDVAEAANPHHVTTAGEQRAQAAALKACLKAEKRNPRQKAFTDEREKQEQQPFRSLGLTVTGLAACGHPKGTVGPNDDTWTTFWNGMKRDEKTEADELGDSERWADEYLEPPHGVWLLANADKDRLQLMVDECGDWLDANYGARAYHAEPGFRWEPYEDSIGYEPFGFADGFMRIKVNVPPAAGLAGLLRRSLDVIMSWFTRGDEMPLGQIVMTGLEDLTGSSFLVFRKLEQNVREFVRAEKELADQLKLLSPDQKPRVQDAGALFVGRERDGTPLVENGRPRQTGFDFKGDKEGRRCPFHAHVRKVNPRQNFKGQGHPLVDDRKDQRKAQFFRRGIVYDPQGKLKPRWKCAEDAPAGGVGLLFMGYMTDVGRQFVEIHSRWAGNTLVPTGKPTGMDPLTKQNQNLDWKWPAQAELKLKVQFMVPLVTAKGGAYFLIPSLPGLRLLGNPIFLEPAS